MDEVKNIIVSLGSEKLRVVSNGKANCTMVPNGISLNILKEKMFRNLNLGHSYRFQRRGCLYCKGHKCINS